MLAKIPGCGFDCASPAEMDQVLECGVRPSRIIYANPCKDVAALEHALDGERQRHHSQYPQRSTPFLPLSITPASLPPQPGGRKLKPRFPALARIFFRAFACGFCARMHEYRPRIHPPSADWRQKTLDPRASGKVTSGPRP